MAVDARARAREDGSWRSSNRRWSTTGCLSPAEARTASSGSPPARQCPRGAPSSRRARNRSALKASCGLTAAPGLRRLPAPHGRHVGDLLNPAQHQHHALDGAAADHPFSNRDGPRPDPAMAAGTPPVPAIRQALDQMNPEPQQQDVSAQAVDARWLTDREEVSRLVGGPGRADDRRLSDPQVGSSSLLGAFWCRSSTGQSSGHSAVAYHARPGLCLRRSGYPLAPAPR